MTEMMHTHQVNVFGEPFSIKADVPKETIEEIAHFVETRIMEIRKNSMTTDKFQIAVLAAMNIAGDYMEAKVRAEACEKHISGLEMKARSLSDSLDLATNAV